MISKDYGLLNAIIIILISSDLPNPQTIKIDLK